MTPFVCVVQYEKPDEDEKSTFIRVSYPATDITASATMDIELTPVQQVLIARQLLDDFDINRIENG